MKLALLSLAAAPLAALLVTQSAMPQLKAHADKLQAAKTMQLELSVQPIGGATYQATLKVQKPNLFQWDSPDRLVTTDGKTIWVYTKATQTYSEDAASATASSSAPNWSTNASAPPACASRGPTTTSAPTTSGATPASSYKDGCSDRARATWPTSSTT